MRGRGKCLLLNKLEISDSTEENQHTVSDHEADDTHDDTYVTHIFLFDKSGRVGDGVRGSTDGEHHGQRSCQSDTDEQGRDATERSQLSFHAATNEGEDGHEQGCCSRVADEV